MTSIPITWLNGILQKTYVVENIPDILNYNLTGDERGKSASQLFSQALLKVSLPKPTLGDYDMVLLLTFTFSLVNVIHLP